MPKILSDLQRGLYGYDRQVCKSLKAFKLQETQRESEGRNTNTDFQSEGDTHKCDTPRLHR